MEREISRIINKALDGSLLTEKEIATLFKVEDFTEESVAIQLAGRRFSSQLLDGKAEIHGQIGIDIGLCHRDCKYCAFAASNKVFTDREELELDKIIEGVHSMEKQGANAIYLMATARYDFEKFIEVSKAVHSKMLTNVPMIANVDDFDLSKAKELLKAGYAGVYHAIRMGEGEFTNIPLEKRIESIKSAQEAGLKVGMCVEPVGPEHTIEELVEKTLLTRDLGAVFSGAMRRTQIPTSVLAKHGQLNYARMATIVGAVSLATGIKIGGNCTHEPNALAVNAGANLLWAEVGSNPRDTNAETVRGWTVNKCRELYHECGWEVLEGPSKMF